MYVWISALPAQSQNGNYTKIEIKLLFLSPGISVWSTWTDEKTFEFTKFTWSTNLVIRCMGFELRRWIQILGLPACCCCCAVAQSCLTFCDPKDYSMPGFPVLHYLPEFAQTHVHRVGDAIQPSHPLSSLLLPPSIFPSIRVSSNESVLCIRWPKYWSLSFSISPSNEYLDFF